jgi:hypothetical protein
MPILSALYKAHPELESTVQTHPYLTRTDTIWEDLEELLQAHAPSGGVLLPGGIGDMLHTIIQRRLPQARYNILGSTGNSGLSFGAAKADLDLLICAHLDRPTFKVRSATTGEVYPICAIRIPGERYQCKARAIRYAQGHLDYGATGTLLIEQTEKGLRFAMQAEEGVLRERDLVVMDAEPRLTDGLIQGTGLDNCLGVVTLLGLAHTLSTQQYLLEAAHVRVMLAFTDQEEGIPEAYFGHGAARLTHYLPQPTLGCMVADGQTVQAEGPLVSQAGSGHGVVSAWSRGTVVPPNYVALAEDLAASVNAIYPRTVQINHGYLSRSDDMALGRWAPILGMIGPPMTGAHTAEEAAYMTDLQAAIRWISHYAVAALGLSTEMREAYTLGAGGK